MILPWGKINCGDVQNEGSASQVIFRNAFNCYLEFQLLYHRKKTLTRQSNDKLRRLLQYCVRMHVRERNKIKKKVCSYVVITTWEQQKVYWLYMYSYASPHGSLCVPREGVAERKHPTCVHVSLCHLSANVTKSYTLLFSLYLSKNISVFHPFFPSTLSLWRRHPLPVVPTWSSPKVKHQKLLECGWEENRLEIWRHYLLALHTLL